jgi:hypothetical protein
LDATSSIGMAALRFDGQAMTPLRYSTSS